ncbi:MAG: hypothetical protein AB1724_18440 [Thermodesulfobacteriota bacterium]
MNAYQIEQLESLQSIRRQLETMSTATKDAIVGETADYLTFRREVAEFHSRHFAGVCTEKCYQSRLSACCSRDGIITFFADMVIHMLVSDSAEIDLMEQAVRHPEFDFKCIYLTQTGCLWKIKPVVCEFFLCDEAENKVFNTRPEALARWKDFEESKKRFTWPDRPVLFETLEKFFMDRGCDSPLMYLHKSPGLVSLRKKRDASQSSSPFIS